LLEELKSIEEINNKKQNELYIFIGALKEEDKKLLFDKNNKGSLRSLIRNSN
jgi:hypothetical protein